jgi:hypothetical protein
MSVMISIPLAFTIFVTVFSYIEMLGFADQ